MGYFFILVAVVVAAVLIKTAIALLRVDRIEASKNAARASGFGDAMLGRVRVQDDWLPDARVQGGMIYNPKKKRIEICGRLSDDTLDRTFR